MAGSKKFRSRDIFVEHPTTLFPDQLAAGAVRCCSPLRSGAFRKAPGIESEANLVFRGESAPAPDQRPHAGVRS